MPQQPVSNWVDDDPNWRDDNKPTNVGLSLRKGLTEGLPELHMLPPEKYPGATRQDWLGSLSRASMYPVGAMDEIYNKLVRPLTSPSNLGLLALSIAQPETIPITASVFSAQQAMQMPEQVKDVYNIGKEKGWSNPETIGRSGELGLSALMTTSMVYGGGKYKAGQISPKPTNLMNFQTEPGFGKLPVIAKQGPEATQLTQVESAGRIQPPVNPGLANALQGKLKPEPTKFDNIIESQLKSIEEVQAAYNAGKLNQDDAIQLIQKLHWNDLMKTKGQVKGQVKPTVTEPVKSPVKTYVLKSESATPELIQKAKEQGYEFQGLTDKGDYKFNKVIEIEPTILDPASLGESIPLTKQTEYDRNLAINMGDRGTFVIPRTQAEYEYLSNIKRAQIGDPPIEGSMELTEAQKTEFYNRFFKRQQIPGEAPPPSYPTITKQIGIPEVAELIKSGQVRNVADLQRQTGQSFEKTREVWYDAKKQLQESLQEMEADIPGIKPHNQLLTPEGLGDIIKAIPHKTGDVELDSMVASFRALRRRKGIDEFNEIETQAYNGLMEDIKNHPALPPELKTKWDGLIGNLKKLFKDEKGEIVIRQGKEPIEATKTGHQEGFGELPGFDIYNITKGGNEAHPLGSTVSEKILRAMGWKPPSEIPRVPPYESLLPKWLHKYLKTNNESIIGKEAVYVISENEKNSFNINTDLRLGEPIYIPREEITQRIARSEIVRRKTNSGLTSAPIVFIRDTTPSTEGRLANFLRSEKGELTIDLSSFKKEPSTIPLNVEPIQPLSKSAEPIILRMKDVPPKQVGIIREVWNLSRGLMSVDLPFITSAGFRQGFPLIGTSNWFKAWIPSFKAYGSKEAFVAHEAMIKADPLVQRKLQPILGLDGKPIIRNGRPVMKETPSITEQAGIVFTDVGSLTTREEAIRSQLGEKIPIYGKHVAGSNRAYTAFINDLRLGAFRNFYDAMPNKNDLVALKKLGEAASVFTGRGSLKVEIPFTGGKEIGIERYASGLAEILFAPKLIASRMHMLNPFNYVMGNPQVRREYLNSTLRMAGAWITLAGLGKSAGFEVSLDPTNSDFGKMKLGNLRLDPGAGFQQFLVLASRLVKGETTSSTTGKTQQFGVGYNSPTAGSILQNFIVNKLHPSLKYFYDATFASENRQFPMADRTLQMAVPMMTSDLISIANDKPEMLPFLAPLISGGMGAQYYDKNSFGKSQFIPPSYDWILGKK